MNRDDIVEYIWRVIGWVRTFIAFGVTMFTAFLPWSAIVTGFLVLLIVIFGYRGCTRDSRLEREAQDKQVESVEKQAEITVETQKVQSQRETVKEAEKTSQNASKASEKALKEANSIRHSQGSTTYEKANAERCLTYPQDPGCGR